MRRGDQKRITEFTNLSRDTVSHYFTGSKPVSKKTKLIISQAIKQLKIDYKLWEHKVRLNPANRYDIYNNLPHGALTVIADKVQCSLVNVKQVLEGKRKDHYGIIKEAELRAAIHIWKTRFCKYKSQL
jgi:hypothetical protein